MKVLVYAIGPVAGGSYRVKLMCYGRRAHICEISSVEGALVSRSFTPCDHSCISHYVDLDPLRAAELREYIEHSSASRPPRPAPHTVLPFHPRGKTA